MKVLYLAPGVFDKGGISRYGRFQIRALRERHGDRAIQVLSKLGPDGKGFEEEVEVAWSGHPDSGLATKIGFSLQGLRLALRDQPAVVLTGHVNLGPLGWVIARLAGALLVQNIYGTEVWTRLGGARRRVLMSADGVISDCHHTADFATRTGLRAEPPGVVWDCVDVKRYGVGSPAPETLSRYYIPQRKRFRLMFLGRLASEARYKGTERLLRLVARLPDEFECVLAGGGDDIGHLRGLAADLDLRDRVSFPGRIREDDMPDIYRSADAFYLVSEFGYDMGEGLPLTPIEALACGVPVIVGDQDGSREILDGSGAGVCVSPGAEEPVIAYLQHLREDPAFHASERKAARRLAERRFSYERFAAETTALLEDMVNRHAPRA